MPETQTFWEHNDQGVKLYRQHAFDLAGAAFERAVGAARLPLAALEVNLGATYLQQKRYPEARRWLEMGAASKPDDQQAHWFLAETLKATGAVWEARAEWDRVYALDPGSPEGRAAEEEIRRWRLATPRDALGEARRVTVDARFPGRAGP